MVLRLLSVTVCLHEQPWLSYSEWSAPVVPVPKTEGTIRLCGDMVNNSFRDGFLMLKPPSHLKFYKYNILHYKLALGHHRLDFRSKYTIDWYFIYSIAD